MAFSDRLLGDGAAIGGVRRGRPFVVELVEGAPSGGGFRGRANRAYRCSLDRGRRLPADGGDR